MQKKIIVILLALSSLISASLLIFVDTNPDAILSGFDELDEKIISEFDSHLIDKAQYRTQSIEVDTSFTRKVYRVRVRPEFSKTLFHLSLHQKLRKYKIDTPSKISMPDEDMDIHIYKNDTIVRSIFLRTDESLTEAESEG